MNRRAFKIFQSYTRKLAPAEKMAVARMVVEQTWTGPFSDRERELSAALVEAQRPDDWFHGGLAGRAPGDVLLPAGVTGCDPRGLGDEIPDRLAHVFITGSFSMAKEYAARANGCVYRVAPVGTVDVDPMVLRTLQLIARDKGFPILERWMLSEELLRALTVEKFCCGSATVLEVLAHG